VIGLGVAGMLNLPDITPLAAAAAWTATTDPDVILQDINLVLTDVWMRSGYAVCPQKSAWRRSCSAADQQKGFLCG
jgi:hypothetical protein